MPHASRLPTRFSSGSPSRLGSGRWQRAPFTGREWECQGRVANTSRRWLPRGLPRRPTDRQAVSAVRSGGGVWSGRAVLAAQQLRSSVLDGWRRTDGARLCALVQLPGVSFLFFFDDFYRAKRRNQSTCAGPLNGFNCIDSNAKVGLTGS